MSELSLYPHQVKGVAYLRSKPGHACLWDEQRVGKTPQAIVASGELGLNRVVIVTTVAGVGVWRHQWKQWDRWNRIPLIVPWSRMSKGGLALPASGVAHLLILDEGHYAKSFGAERTRSVYGMLHGSRLIQDRALVPRCERVWHLTGTPAPHDPGDLFPVLIALFPEVLTTKFGYPDVTTFEKFRSRYCVMAMRMIGGRMIKVVIRGQNTDELQRRLKGLFLRRRQADVGIRPAFWDLLPVEIGLTERNRMLAAIDGDAILRAMRNRQPLQDLEPMLAPIRRITGVYKARAVVDDAADFLGNGDEKLVISYWHREVGDELEKGLNRFRPVRVDGSVTGEERTVKVAHFQSDKTPRVFLAQIAACGEAIDLSAASEMWFAESTFTPSQMAQMGARITNIRQKRQCLVRVAALADSIDELIQGRLIDLSRSIAHTLGETYSENFASNRV